MSGWAVAAALVRAVAAKIGKTAMNLNAGVRASPPAGLQTSPREGILRWGNSVKRFFFVVLKILLPIVGILLLGIGYLYTHDYANYYRERRGSLTAVQAEQAESDSLFQKVWVNLESDGGLQVACGLLAPVRSPGAPQQRHPAIIVLGGKTTGKYAINYAFDVRDVVIIAPDYPYSPRPSYSLVEFLVDVPAMRKAAIDMVPSVMLVMDYLARRPDVDTSRIVLLGYSFGAPLVPAVIAQDRRPAVAAMAYGAGDLTSLIRHNVARYRGRLESEFVGRLAGLLLRPLEPLRYVESISPTPLVMINGTQDEQIPRENVDLLYRTALEPKKLIWLESRHVNPRNVELTARIIQTLKAELTRLGIL